jgi:hypothetical protein
VGSADENAKPLAALGRTTRLRKDNNNSKVFSPSLVHISPVYASLLTRCCPLKLPTTFTTKSTASTLGVRKRAALGDVTNNGTSNASNIGLGKKASTSTKQSVASRTRTRSASSNPAGELENVKEENDDGEATVRASRTSHNAMQVDEAVAVEALGQRAARSFRQTSTAAKEGSSLVPRRAPLASKSNRPLTTQTTGVVPKKSVAKRVVREPKPIVKNEIDDDEEDRPAAKRLKTSPVVEDIFEDEEEALVKEEPPKDLGWVDLDAEDADDPLMVSEYVVEVYEYLREIEVSFPIKITTKHRRLTLDGT